MVVNELRRKIMLKVNTIQVKDCIEGLKDLPNECVQCCVSSPPYYRLRDYGVKGQYGLEDTPEAYIEKMAAVFEEVKRVLKKDGTLWLNLGDSYWGSGKAGNSAAYKEQHAETARYATQTIAAGLPTLGKHPTIKHKDLIGIPWLVAMALRERGWYLRQDIIWHKRNCMPESVADRCTRAHEYVFLFSKQPQYYFNADAISTIQSPEFLKRYQGAIIDNKYTTPDNGVPLQSLYQPRPATKDAKFSLENLASFKANRRSVWSISYKGFSEKHFATFPLELPTLCIKAGSKEKDIVLDPFMGAGTTALAAGLLERYYLGFELNPMYAAIAERRLRSRLGLFYREHDLIINN